MQRVATFLQLSGLYLFALCMQFSTAATNIGLAFIILSAILQYRQLWYTVKQQPLFYLALSFVIYMIIRQLWFPFYPDGKWSDVQPWGYLTLFWLVGWAMGENVKIWYRVLGLVVISFVIRLTIGFDMARISEALHGGRGFGFSPQTATIGFALLMATLLLGWVIWRKKILEIFPERFKWPAIGMWLVLFVLFFEALVMAKSRGTWLAALIGFTALVVMKWLSSDRNKLNWKHVLVSLLAIALVVGLNFNTMSNRVDSESSTYEAILHAHSIDDVPYTSAGYRIHMYYYAVQMFKVHPWLGWGAGSTSWLLQHAPDPNIHQFPHFHSGYFEVLMQFGLVGILLFSAVIIVAALSLRRSYQQGLVPREFIWFLSAGLVIALVWNGFDVRFEHTDYRFYSLFMMGLLFAVTRRVWDKKADA